MFLYVSVTVFTFFKLQIIVYDLEPTTIAYISFLFLHDF